MSNFVSAARRLPFVRSIINRLNNLNERTAWVRQELQSLPNGAMLLDAGCGSQQFRKFTSHLVYRSQDFGQYISDEKQMLGAPSGGIGEGGGYNYGKLNYVGDIWSIDEKDATFDAILCTEVFEHIPFPIETIREFSRLLKPGGILILTAPSNCLRHMDPYFFYSGFSDRWYQKFLPDHQFEISSIQPVGDYYSWMSVEIARTIKSHSAILLPLLFPAFLYYYNKKKTSISSDTLCMGYHVRAVKLPA